MVRYLSLMVVVSLLCGCKQSEPDTLVKSGYDEQEMAQAIARARREVDSFISEMNQPTGSSHSVKAAVKDKDETEHFWLNDVVYENGEFQGKIGNQPGIVSNVKLGQNWTVKKDEISDWMFIRDGKMYGNYTLRPLLKTLPPKEAEMLQSKLANP